MIEVPLLITNIAINPPEGFDLLHILSHIARTALDCNRGTAFPLESRSVLIIIIIIVLLLLMITLSKSRCPLRVRALIQ